MHNIQVRPTGTTSTGNWVGAIEGGNQGVRSQTDSQSQYIDDQLGDEEKIVSQHIVSSGTHSDQNSKDLTRKGNEPTSPTKSSVTTYHGTTIHKDSSFLPQTDQDNTDWEV